MIDATTAILLCYVTVGSWAIGARDLLVWGLGRL